MTRLARTIRGVCFPLYRILAGAFAVLVVSLVLTTSVSNAQGTGALVIAGGASLPESIRKEFVQLAGGSGHARIVAIPTASFYADDAEWVEGRLETWRELGAASIDLLHTRDPLEADRPDFVESLREANGVWIGGGDQSRLTETYSGTLVETELRALLERGGVIGGTSAGAAVMSDPMIVGGREVARTGPGFGFLKGFIVDQHFVARERIGRLRGVLTEHEGFAGLGIDEGTAVIVNGGEISVLGDSTVTAIWPRSSSQSGRERTLKSGERLDLGSLRAAAAGGD